MPTPRAVNAAGLLIVRRREGCRLTAYRDERGRLTIGWGHTGPDVKEGLTISQVEADAMFEADVAFHSAGVERGLRVDVSENQFAALVSLTFNIGIAAFLDSTLLKTLNGDPVRCVPPDHLGAANRFLEWKYVTDEKTKVKRVSANLLERRHLERDLFLSGTKPRVA